MSDVKTGYVGAGKVVLIAGGGKVYTDIAARFVRSERDLEDIISSEYDANLVRSILESGHKAALEFDDYLFGVSGYSRVTEVQLVRKRHASYMVKSGRQELNGKREFSVVLPDASIAEGHWCYVTRDTEDEHYIEASADDPNARGIDGQDLLEMTAIWYNSGVRAGLPEEKLRYWKPQATEFKAIVSMNAHALYDFFGVRCCHNAQEEIRDMAMKMLNICKDVSPDIFAKAGANCVQLGYCPENKRQCATFKGKIYTQDEAREILKQHRRAAAQV